MSGSDRDSQCPNAQQSAVPPVGSTTDWPARAGIRLPDRTAVRCTTAPAQATQDWRADRRTHARRLCACHGAHTEPSYALRLGVASATSRQAVGLGPCERSLRASHPGSGSGRAKGRGTRGWSRGRQGREPRRWSRTVARPDGLAGA